ncbi:MAG: hypothetical protein J6T10_12865 [Methanobrevibacter sp.]|nr:hypothetical protein [Methanobrevibacter sp.]
MYQLTFNGYFEVEYPDEFLAELEELKKKHDVYFFGQPILRDLGHYVDFQKEDSSDVSTEPITNNTSEENSSENEKV